MKKKLDVRIAWVAALAVWYTPAFAGVDRCASPSAEEFARNPELSSSASEIRDIAAGVRRKAEPLIAASVAREREAERERQAEQARLRAEREAEQARRQSEWEAGRPEREARIEARKRERARQRELDRRDAAIRRQNWENAINATVQGIQALTGAYTSSGGGASTRGRARCGAVTCDVTEGASTRGRARCGLDRELKASILEGASTRGRARCGARLNLIRF